MILVMVFILLNVMRTNLPTKIVTAAALLVIASPVGAKEYSIGTEAATEYIQARIVAKPAPVIPPHMLEDAFELSCLARFDIDAEGKTKPHLLTSSGSEEIDDATLSTLKQWKFRPAMLDGRPVSSSRKVKIEFEVH